MLQTCLETDQKSLTATAPLIRVLIVEKHPAVRRALRKRLSATSELDVIGAVEDIAVALGYLSQKEPVGVPALAPDVVVLGLQNPQVEDSEQLVAAIRELCDRPESIVVLSPYADEAERRLLAEAGVQHYLLKHIDSYLLIQAIVDAAHR